MSDMERDFLTIMEESIRNKGTIDHIIARGVFVGPGRSGKNTLMKRLMGEGPPRPVSSSTGVLEASVRVEGKSEYVVRVERLSAVSSEEFIIKWKKLNYDEEALELLMLTATNYSHSGYITPKRMKYSQSTKACTDKEGLSKNISTDTPPLDIFKKALKLRRMDAPREHLESSWSLYLTNTGGMLESLEHLPLLVSGGSIFFVTFPLHYDLDEPYEVRYEHPDGSIKTYVSPSLIQEILQTLASISTLDEEIAPKPTVFIIGTHKDLLKAMMSSEQIAAIDQKLQTYIRQTSLFRQGSIQFASVSGKQRLIFTVNNLSQDDTDFQMIRSAVQQKVRQNEFTVQCPSSWLIFSLILHEKHKSSRVLSLEDCFQIAQECGISSRDELTRALSFIHSRLGPVRYFDVEGLDSLVVVDPRILCDKITDLKVNAFASRAREIEEFRTKGIVSVASIKRISERSSELPFTWLMNLLNHLQLVALFKGHHGENYFFPSALCNAPRTQTRQPTPSMPPPAVIAFESGFCPRGLAGALIKCLMTNEIKSKKSWKLLPDTIFSNQVSFHIEACDDVTLKILPTHLEIALVAEEYSRDSDDRRRTVTCKEAYTQTNKCMKIVTSLYKKCEYFWTFYCTLDECKAIQHPAVVKWRNNRPTALRCKTHNKSSHLPRGYNIWNFARKHNERGKTCSMHD